MMQALRLPTVNSRWKQLLNCTAVVPSSTRCNRTGRELDVVSHRDSRTTRSLHAGIDISRSHSEARIISRTYPRRSSTRGPTDCQRSLASGTGLIYSCHSQKMSSSATVSSPMTDRSLVLPRETIAGQEDLMFYSSGFLDRSGDKRSDDEYLQSALKDPETLVRHA